MGLRIDIVTIFPGYFDSPLRVSLIGKAVARGDIEFGVHDLRSWATDVHHSVDDVPFGGGPLCAHRPAGRERGPFTPCGSSSAASAVRTGSAARS